MAAGAVAYFAAPESRDLYNNVHKLHYRGKKCRTNDLSPMNPGGHEIKDAPDLIAKWVTFICANGIVVAGVHVEGAGTDPERGTYIRYTLPGHACPSRMPLSAMGFLYVHPVREYDDYVSTSQVHAGHRASYEIGPGGGEPATTITAPLDR